MRLRIRPGVGQDIGNTLVQDMGNTCRECLVMVLVFWLLVNGREIGVAGNGAEGAGATEAELPAWRLGRLLNGF